MPNDNSRVQENQTALREAGLRPVQIWAPDTRLPHFAEECRRQSLLVAQADQPDTDLLAIMEEALADLEGWTD